MGKIFIWHNTEHFYISDASSQKYKIQVQNKKNKKKRYKPV